MPIFRGGNREKPIKIFNTVIGYRSYVGNGIEFILLHESSLCMCYENLISKMWKRYEILRRIKNYT